MRLMDHDERLRIAHNAEEGPSKPFEPCDECRRQGLTHEGTLDKDTRLCRTHWEETAEDGEINPWKVAALEKAIGVEHNTAGTDRLIEALRLTPAPRS